MYVITRVQSELLITGLMELECGVLQQQQAAKWLSQQR